MVAATQTEPGRTGLLEVVIRPIGFLDTSAVMARYVLKYRDQANNGLLYLRDLDDEGEAQDLPLLKEWRSAKALLNRYKATASEMMKGQTAVLGKAWIETLPGAHGTPWTIEEDEYAQVHIRTRTCLIPVPQTYTFSGEEKVTIGVGTVNIVEHRILHCEVNFSAYPRTHLIVDVRRPEEEAEK